MGYELHITRKENWSDENTGLDISLAEWLAYMDADPELKPTFDYMIRVPGSETERMPAPGHCDWTGHSSDEKPWLAYFQGCIDAKYPDEETIGKMISIAAALDAKVQGDDGELYTRPANDEAFQPDLTPAPERPAPAAPASKPWWKFW